MTKEVVLHEEVEKHQSRLRAQNAIERVAVAGRFTAVSFNEAGIVFEKTADNGTVTRLSIRKVGPKVFESVHATFIPETAPDTQRPEVGGTIPSEQAQVHERRRK